MFQHTKTISISEDAFALTETVLSDNSQTELFRVSPTIPKFDTKKPLESALAIETALNNARNQVKAQRQILFMELDANETKRVELKDESLLVFEE